jgi:hypothetical protein
MLNSFYFAGNACNVMTGGCALKAQVLTLLPNELDCLQQQEPKHSTHFMVWVTHRRRVTHLKLSLSNS